MKKHKQMCGLALATELIGDRWTLLIVRELLTGPKRFTDLRKVLPSLAPNLLTSRLNLMTLNGLVEHVDASVMHGSCYQLTDLGLTLKEVVYSLVRWGGQFIPQQKGGVRRHSHWLLVALPALLEKKAIESAPSICCHLEVDSFLMTLSISKKVIQVQQGFLGQSDLKIKMTYQNCLAVFSGYLTLQQIEDEAHCVIEGPDDIRKKFETFLC